MPNEFIARNGVIALNNSTVTGSLTVTSGITGSLFGTSSWAQSSSVNISSSFATTASYALTSSFAVTASYVNYITGSGTTNRHSKFTVGNTIGDSLIFDDGTNVQITGSTVTISGSSASLIVTGSVRSSGGFTGSISASNLQGSILNSQLQNSSITVGSTAISLGATSTTLAGLSSVSSTSFTGSFTGSLTGAVIGTSSWATNAVTASFASTSSFVNTLNQNVLISGSLTVGSSSIGSSENTLILGPSPAGGAGEGGQMLLQAPGGTYTSASMLDNWQNYTRLLRGTNASSDAVVAQFNMHSKQITFPAYVNTSAFPGTATANLAVDSSGNVITVSTSGGTVFPYTGTAVISGSLVVTDAGGNTGAITASGPIRSLVNNAMYFRGGDDAEFWDINAVNTVGIYGQQTQAEGSIKLGSNGSRLYGSGSNLGINTTTPNSASLHVSGNVFATSFTGSISSSFLQGAILNSQLANSSITVGSTNISLGATSTTLAGLTSVSSTSLTGSLTASSLVGAITNTQLVNSSTTIGTTAISLGGSSTTITGLTAINVTGSVRLSGSAVTELVVLGQQEITGSLSITNGVIAQSVSASFTGSLTGALIGTASWATNATTATQVSSNLTQGTGVTAFTYNGSSAQTVAVSGASNILANEVVKWTGTAFDGSNITDNGSNVTISGSTLSVTASAITFGSASLNTTFRITGSVISQGGFTGSLLGTSSWANNVVTAQTASYLNNLNQNLTVSGTLTISASTSNNSLVTIGDLIVSGGIYATASTGNLSFRGVGNAQFTGSVSSTGGFTGSLFGTASYVTGSIYSAGNLALSASYAVTAAYALTGGTAGGSSFPYTGSAIISGSLLVTGSVSATQGGFTGSLLGTAATSSKVAVVGYSAGTTSYLIVTSDSTFGAVGKQFGNYQNELIYDSSTKTLNITSSWATNVVGGSAAFPYAGTAVITGSVVQQTGSAFFPTLNASESLAAGDWVNISASFVRKASSDNTTKQCHGFVITAVASGSAATIYYNGINPALSGLTAGARYFLSASGAESTLAPNITGLLSQELGVAVSTTALLTNIGPAIIT